MERLGISTEKFLTRCKGVFSLKTTMMLVTQMLKRIEFIHSRYFIHRDIKPDNFLMGLGKNENKVYCIDFGLSKRYRCIKTGSHIPIKQGKLLTGTARYSSLNTHLGIEQSRRDDLEALGYIVVYFLKGELPWQGFKSKSKEEKYFKIMEKKTEVTVEKLCSDLPGTFLII